MMKRVTRLRDDALATFTDQILEEKEHIDISMGEASSERLEPAIRLLKRNTRFEQPTQELIRQIHARLVSEWHTSGPGQKASWQLKKKTRQFYVIGFALIIIMGVISTILLRSDLHGNMQGSATEISPLVAITGILIIILGLIVWTVITNSRRRKK